MTIRYASQTEIQSWNNQIANNPDGGNIFQGDGFARTKAAYNWNVHYLVVGEIYILVLERKIPFLGNFWYIPKGPGVLDIDSLKKILPELRKFAKQNNVFLIKLEPQFVNSKPIIIKLNKLNLKKRHGVQVPNTIFLDISKDIDDIVARFSPKTRYNIRSAKKANVVTEVVQITDESCRLFYELLVKTIHGRAHLRDFEYYQKFWKSHYDTNSGIFLFAKVNDNIISMNFIAILGKKAARKDAASTREFDVRGASALLEVETIKYLKEQGVEEYDFCGTPPSDQVKNQSHPYYGVGSFKAGFNSTVTDFIGCCDLEINPIRCMVWEKIGERIAHKIYYFQHHDLYY